MRADNAEYRRFWDNDQFTSRHQLGSSWELRLPRRQLRHATANTIIRHPQLLRHHTEGTSRPSLIAPAFPSQSGLNCGILKLLLRPGRGVEYCDQPVSVCLSVSVCTPVCVCVCQRAYLLNCWTDRHEILFADPLWPWLGPSPAAFRYVMDFRFYGWRHVAWLAWWTSVSYLRDRAESDVYECFVLKLFQCFISHVTASES